MVPIQQSCAKAGRGCGYLSGIYRSVITPAHRAAALIRKGQRAWKAIKGTAEEQRIWWFDVGTALAEGKKLTKAERGGIKFSAWCLEQFPDIDTDNDVPAAIWYAEEFPQVEEKSIPKGMSLPRSIREWFDARQPAAAAPWDGDEPAPEVVEVPAAKKFKTQRDAEKFIKVDQRAESGQEGSDTAARHRASFAKAHGTTVEALREESANAAPDAFFRFAPAVQKSLDDFRNSNSVSIGDMRKAGISGAAIRAIFRNLADGVPD